mmetsp:Transcript_4384/g.12656  ORF Transcript_4384/g.12656 Transcript_4384/m.12656 type:complete len:464 (+) Transcript_4384:335-1726(+)
MSLRTLVGVTPRSIMASTSAIAAGLRPGTPGAAAAASPAIAGAHCYHGFGANSWSWSFVQAKLANALGVTVTAHDMPAFGLTERPKKDSFFSLDFNGKLGRAILESQLQEEASIPTSPDATSADSSGKNGHSSSDGGSGNSYSSSTASHNGVSGPQNGKRDADSVGKGSRGGNGMSGGRILIGHSLGAACAAAEAIARPEGIAALVLVAPAIVALRLGRQEATQEHGRECAAVAAGDGAAAQRAAASAAEFRSNTASTIMQSIGSIRSRVVRVVAAVGFAAVASLTRLALLAAGPLLVVALRGSVRNRRFWESGLSRAWYRKDGVTPEVVDAYRLPQLVRGWEGGMVAFLRARVTAGQPFGARLAAAYHGREHMTQVEQLLDAVTQHGIKVLIVHGEGDALVPAANSRRLAAILPGATLCVLPRCGHNPQEELPNEFVKVVTEFVESELRDEADLATASDSAV